MSIKSNIIITSLIIVMYSYSQYTSKIIEIEIPTYQAVNQMSSLSIDSTIFTTTAKLNSKIKEIETTYPSFMEQNKFSINSTIPQIPVRSYSNRGIIGRGNIPHSKTTISYSRNNSQSFEGSRKCTEINTGFTVLDKPEVMQDDQEYVMGGGHLERSKTTISYFSDNSRIPYKSSRSFDQSAVVLNKHDALITPESIKAHKKTIATQIIENRDIDQGEQLAKILTPALNLNFSKKIKKHKDPKKQFKECVQVIDQTCDKRESHIILSIDGGGIKGKVPCRILDELSNKGIDLRAKCDIITGTSIGGILAVLLLIQDKNGTYLYTPKLLNGLIKDNRKKIFNKRYYYCTGLGLFGSKYKNNNLKTFLEDLIENKEGNVIKKLSDIRQKTTKRLIIPAYDMLSQTTYLFDSNETDINFRLVDICMATSAAPIYFPTYAFQSLAIGTNRNKTHFNCIDGGIFLNFPASASIIKSIFNETSLTPDIFLISISTGYTKKTTINNQSKSWGIFGWLKHKILNLILNTATSFSEDILSKALGEKFIRIEVPLKEASSKMDNVSEKNLKNLDRDIEAFIKTDLFQSQIEKMAEELDIRSCTCASIDFDASLYSSSNDGYHMQYSNILNESYDTEDNNNYSLANI